MNKALLVIDVQQGMFANPAYPPYDGEAIVARIGGLVARARKAGLPVIFVQHDGDELATGTPGHVLHPGLGARESDPHFVKKFRSAFQQTGLERWLKEHDITALTICGMQSDYCVDSAVRGAVERGYKVTLVSDGHSTFDTPVLKAKDIVAHANFTLGRGFTDAIAAADVRFG